MYFGFHASAAGGVDQAPERAAAEGAEVFQFFSRSPRGGPAPKLTKEIITNWQVELKKHSIQATYIHAPYYINFASTNDKIRYGSVAVIRDELERGTVLGVKGLMTHLGSSKDVGEKEGTKKTIEGITKVLTGYKGTTKFLLENAAGAGAVIGDTMEELSAIIKGVEKNLKKKNVIGVCWDTQHGFASGYDIRTKATIDSWLKKFDTLIGLDRLVLFHANDSKIEFNGHKDRHDDIGFGLLGENTFKLLIQHPKLKKLDMILETPAEKVEYAETIKLFKKFRGAK